MVVLAKRPVPGNVKTRLCPPLTPAQAARLAAAALADTLDTVRVTPGVRRVLALDNTAGYRYPGLHVIAQRGGALADRICHALRDATSSGSPTLLIGMDTPQLRPDMLAAALAALRRPGADAVLGPAEDGGWWALGLREPVRATLISEVATSRASTGAETRRALQAGGLAVATLPPLRDVDTILDAEFVATQAPGSRFAGTLAGLTRQVSA